MKEGAFQQRGFMLLWKPWEEYNLETRLTIVEKFYIDMLEMRDG